MAASSGRTLMKDFHHMMRNLNSFTDGQVEIMDDWEEKESLDNFNLLIKPNAGPYQGGGFEFNMKIPEEYPAECPKVKCMTPIYHPNIDPSNHDVCLNLLDKWKSSMTLDDMVQGLLFLMYNPQIDDALSGLFDGDENYETFVENVRKSLRGNGATVGGFDFNNVNIHNSNEEDTYTHGVAEEDFKKRMESDDYYDRCDTDDEEENEDDSNIVEEVQCPEDASEWPADNEQVCQLSLADCNITSTTDEEVDSTKLMPENQQPVLDTENSAQTSTENSSTLNPELGALSVCSTVNNASVNADNGAHMECDGSVDCSASTHDDEKVQVESVTSGKNTRLTCSLGAINITTESESVQVTNDNSAKPMDCTFTRSYSCTFTRSYSTGSYILCANSDLAIQGSQFEASGSSISNETSGVMRKAFKIMIRPFRNLHRVLRFF